MVDPSLPDPEKLAAVREAIPSLAAGIYLNTGSVGPLPAETAAAMADMAAYERDVGRAHFDYFLEFTPTYALLWLLAGIVAGLAARDTAKAIE